MNIYDIAEKSGVSISTVSRVLNGKTDISSKTRQKILDVMRQNNFQPKVISAKNDVIAVFIRMQKGDHVSNPYTASILFGISDHVIEQNMKVMIVSSTLIPKDSLEFMLLCQQNNIGGGIFLLSTLEDKYIEALADVIPLAVVGNSFENPKVACFREDNFKGAYDITKYLIGLGHRKIMFLVPDLDHSDHVQRYEGMKKAMSENGLGLSPYDLTNHFDQEILTENITKIMLKDNRPTAIFAASDQVAIKLMSILAQLNIKVPEDISIAGFDDLEISKSTIPPLTTVHAPIYEIGAEAAKYIINMINEKNIIPEYYVLPTYTVIRESCKNLNK